MSTGSDYKATLRRAEHAGCRIARTGRHLRIIAPNGTRITASRSPSDVNAVRQLRRDLARAGVTL